MTRKNAHLTGMFAAIPTPFTADGSAIDAEGIRAQIERMVAGGVQGVVPTGTSGEFTSLTSEEYRDVIRLNVEAAAGRIKVIAGIGHTSTAGAIELARYAEEVGADAIMLVAPFYDPLSFEALQVFLQDVADEINLQIMYYNLPAATGITLDAEQLAKLGSIDGVDYFKDASGDAVSLTALLTSRTDSITVFNGWDSLTFLGFSLGAKGSVWGVASVAPAQTVELFHVLAVEKDLDRGRELWAPLWNLCSVLESVNYSAGLKTALELLGSPVGPVRKPLLPLEAGDRERIATALRGLGLLSS